MELFDRRSRLAALAMAVCLGTLGWPVRAHAQSAGNLPRGSSASSAQQVYRLPPTYPETVPPPQDTWSDGAPDGPPPAWGQPTPADPRAWSGPELSSSSGYPTTGAPAGTSPFDDPFEDRVVEPCSPDDPCGPPCPPPPATSQGWLVDHFTQCCNWLNSCLGGGGGGGGGGHGSNLFTHPDNPGDDEHLLGKWTLMNFTVFGGMQGFQGPVDEGNGSNFGLHLGFNWAVPLFENLGISHQSGVNWASSDLSGGSGFLTHRNQFFLTSGFYHRPVSGTGWQFGGVADYMHDDWYVKMDLAQMRAEFSYVGKIHEVGLMGAYHWSTMSQTSPLTGNNIQWQTIDQFMAFYRRRLHGIGQARFFAGATGQGDFEWGGDGTSMLTTHWGFNTNFVVTFPRSNASLNEAWGLSMNLVWFPGYMNPQSALNPYRALFDVADNTWLLIKQSGK